MDKSALTEVSVNTEERTMQQITQIRAKARKLGGKRQPPQFFWRFDWHFDDGAKAQEFYEWLPEPDNYREV